MVRVGPLPAVTDRVVVWLVRPSNQDLATFPAVSLRPRWIVWILFLLGFIASFDAVLAISSQMSVSGRRSGVVRGT